MVCCSFVHVSSPYPLAISFATLQTLSILLAMRVYSPYYGMEGLGVPHACICMLGLAWFTKASEEDTRILFIKRYRRYGVCGFFPAILFFFLYPWAG